jgi:hypothetical protein
VEAAWRTSDVVLTQDYWSHQDTRVVGGWQELDTLLLITQMHGCHWLEESNLRVHEYKLIYIGIYTFLTAVCIFDEGLALHHIDADEDNKACIYVQCNYIIVKFPVVFSIVCFILLLTV